MTFDAASLRPSLVRYYNAAQVAEQAAGPLNLHFWGMKFNELAAAYLVGIADEEPWTSLLALLRRVLGEALATDEDVARLLPADADFTAKDFDTASNALNRTCYVASGLKTKALAEW